MEIQNEKTQKKIVLILLGFLIFSFASALSSPPPLPNHFSGNVTLYGNAAPIGTLIDVYMEGTLEQAYNITQAGKYDLYVKTGNSGENIEFKINGKVAGIANRTNGEVINLNLELTSTPAPNTPPSSSSSSSGSSSGGGGGGSGGSIIPKNTSAENSTEDINEQMINQGFDNETVTETDNNAAVAGITGAVVGFARTGRGIVAIAAVIILTAGVMLIKFKPQKWKKR